MEMPEIQLEEAPPEIQLEEAPPEIQLEEAPPQTREIVEVVSPAVTIFRASSSMAPVEDPTVINVHGGSINGTCSYGYGTYKNRRPTMEDNFEIWVAEVNRQRVAFFGVFDGHGGARTAEYLKDHLFNNLSAHPALTENTRAAIVDVFRETDDAFLNQETGQQKDAGSTAATAILVGDHLFVANVGDSRVVACKAGLVCSLTDDHKPERTDERERIEGSGGFVMWAGVWRVGGALAVSRAFGDKTLKVYVPAEPEIQEENINGVEFLILASDGLWNGVSNQEAVDIVRSNLDDGEATRALMNAAVDAGSTDNIACVVIRFERSS